MTPEGITHAQAQQIIRAETEALRRRVLELEKRVSELRQANNELRRGILSGTGLSALEELWRT